MKAILVGLVMALGLSGVAVAAEVVAPEMPKNIVLEKPAVSYSGMIAYALGKRLVWVVNEIDYSKPGACEKNGFNAAPDGKACEADGEVGMPEPAVGCPFGGTYDDRPTPPMCVDVPL